MTGTETESREHRALPGCRYVAAGATGKRRRQPFPRVADAAKKHTKRWEAASGWEQSVPAECPGRADGQGGGPGLARPCHGQGTEDGPAWSERRALRGVGEEGDPGHTGPSGKGCALALAADLCSEHTGFISGSAFAHGNPIFWDQPTESGLGVPGTRDVANTQCWFLSAHRGLPEQKGSRKGP